MMTLFKVGFEALMKNSNREELYPPRYKKLIGRMAWN